MLLIDKLLLSKLDTVHNHRILVQVIGKTW